MTWLAVARLGLLATIVSAGLAGWSIMEAVRLDDPVPVPVADDGDAPGEVARPRSTRANIVAAVNVDPFNPARERPATPYRLPGEVDSVATTGRGARPPQLRVLGTVVFTSGGGFATCQLGGDRPAIVHVGEKIGNYTLKSLARGSATFTGPAGETLQINALQSGR